MIIGVVGRVPAATRCELAHRRYALGLAGTVNCRFQQVVGYQRGCRFVSTRQECPHRALYRHARQSAEKLRYALEHRAVIDQAKGILMASRKITAEQAFAVLAKQSQHENIKLRDLAAGLVDRASSGSLSEAC